MPVPAFPPGAFYKSFPHLTLEGTGRSEQEVQDSMGLCSELSKAPHTVYDPELTG